MPKRQTTKNSSSVGACKSRAGTNPRSRSGCVTCKAKHTKCDETRPECLRCTRKGIKCGGYWREFKWSFKHQPDSGESTLDLPDVASINEFTTLIATGQDTEPAPRRTRHGGSISSEVSLPSISSSTDDSSTTERTGSLPPIVEHAEQSVAPIIPRSEIILPTCSPSLTSNSPILGTSSTIHPDEEQDVAASTLIPTNVFPEVPMYLTTPITDTSSLLITNWFEQVCPAWSGFDSPTNLNRRLATELWHESRSVFGCLQSMSAAFLSTRLPHMRQPAVRLMQTATESIQAEVRAIKTRVHLDTVPTGLLFSLFCVGTTVCWIDTTQLGLPFFREAKLILDRLNRRLAAYHEKDIEIIQFFNKCMAYCEMLLAVVSDSGLPALEQAPAQREGPKEKTNGVDGVLHPWTGISTTTSRLFAQSIKLCRSYRRRLRRQRQEGISFDIAVEEIGDAQKLEEELLELEFPSDYSNDDTGDHRTPYLHLAKIAEAYQLGALLNLYQTFPELVSFRLPINSTTLYGGDATWEEWIIPLSLRLVRVMEHIPPSSGSRAIQPLLYISASTGLRYDTNAPFDLLELPWNSGLGTMQEQLRPSYDAMNPLSPETISMSQSCALAPGLISQLSLDISNARHFIMARLSILENTLPPKPVKVAKKLIRAVWDAYDNEMPGCTTVHWVDVMEDNNLRTMFG